MLQQYQDGDTRTIGGATYVRQGGQWRRQGQGGQEEQPRLAPMPGYTPPPRPAPPPPSGYQPADGGLAPIPGGPADPNRREPPSGYRVGPNGNFEPIPGGPADPNRPQGPADAGSEQGKAAGFFNRAMRSNRMYEDTGVGARDLAGEAAADTLPEDWVNYASSGERQVAESAMRDFVAATLRYESGAAIPPEEMQTQARIFFPMPGDTPETMAAKAELRRNAIAALRVGGGPASDQFGREFFGENINRLGDVVDRAVGQGGQAAVELTVEQRQQITEAARTARSPEELQAAIDRITGGAGRIDNPEEVIRFRDETGRTSDEVISRPGGMGRALHLGIGDVAQGAGDILGIVGNPANAGINAMLGTDLSVDLGRTFREATGAPDPETRSEQLASALVRGGTGGLSLAGGARAAAPLFSGAIQNALSRFGAMPVTDAFTGATGAGSAETARQMGAGIVGQTVAGLVGGASALPVANRVSRMASRPAPVENALSRAGQQEGVDVNRAMVDPDVQQRVTAVDRTMVGGPIMQREMNRVGRQIEGRVDRLGRGGQAMEEDATGQTVQRTAERYIRNSGQQASRLYDAAEAASEGVRVQPQQSLQAIDDVLARLRETPETAGAEIAFLERLRNDFSTDLSVSALRRIRTQLRSRITNGGLTFGEDEATVLGIMDTAAQDIAAGLESAGRGRAAQLFRRADDTYRERMQFINGTIQRLIGRRNANLPPETIAARFRAMARPRGDSAGLARMIREMEPEEQADVAATFANALGRNNRGEFSTAHLVSQLEKLPRSARVNVFGPEGARSLSNLERLAREHSRVKGAMGGSPTGVANDWRSWLGTLFLGGGSGFAIDGGMAAIGTAGAALAAKGGRDVINARLLMSRDIQNWLRNAPRSNDPRAINRHFDRLRVIATRQPALASEIQQLQQLIMRAANDSLERGAVASEPDNEQRR